MVSVTLVCIAKKKNLIDWDIRKKEFLKLIDEIHTKSKKENSFYDCVVPWSGGKDSSSIALKLKFEYDLNPLLVTFSPLLINDCGRLNRIELSKMGFDSIFLSPNQLVSQKLAKRFFIERGNPKVAWDAGVNAGPIQVAVNYNIPTVFYAEHGESEYGGLVLNDDSEKKRDIREVIEHQIGDYPENWTSDDISIKDLKAVSVYLFKSDTNADFITKYIAYITKINNPSANDATLINPIN